MKYRIDSNKKEILLDQALPVQELIDEVARGSLLEYTIRPGGAGIYQYLEEASSEQWQRKLNKELASIKDFGEVSSMVEGWVKYIQSLKK